MLIKKFREIVLLMMAVAIGASSSASAGTISYISSLGNHLENFNDDSFEFAVLDQGQQGVLDVGDVLTGVFLFNSIGKAGGTIGTDRTNTSTATQPEVTGIYEAVVTGKSGGPGAYTFDFGPTVAFQLLYGTGALAAIYEDPANDFVGNASIATSIASATGGTLLGAIGFTGAAGTAGAFEGWRASTQTDLLGLASLFGATAFGSYQANLNQVGAPAPLDALNIPQTQFSTFAPFPAALGFTQFNINGQLKGDVTSAANSWTLSDSSDVYFDVRPVPEPSSMIVFGMLLGGVLVAGRKRMNG